MIRIWIVLFAVWSGVGVAADTPKSIDDAVSAYQAALDTEDRNHRVQQFRRSETLFESVIRQQLDAGVTNVSPDLRVNLGNAALGAEDLGGAILAYRQALATDPRHRQAKQNLLHARSLLPDWIAPEEEVASFGSFMETIGSRSRDDLFGLATIPFLLAMVLLAVYIRWQATWARNLSILGVLVWGALMAGAILLKTPAAETVVVIAPEVVARSADSINAPARFPEPLPGGTELTLLEDRGDWIHGRLADGREAWVRASSVGWVTPSRTGNLYGDQNGDQPQ